MSAAVSLPNPGTGTRTTQTHCPYCSLQCGVTMTAGDRPATLVPADFPTNRGGLCSKGWSAPELLDHPERLTRPLVRADPADRSSPLVEAGWTSPWTGSSTRSGAPRRSTAGTPWAASAGVG